MIKTGLLHYTAHISVLCVKISVEYLHLMKSHLYHASSILLLSREYIIIADILF